MWTEFRSRIVNGQKVGDSKRSAEPVKSFTVAWNIHQATIGDIVGINATV